jgi:crotonobetainyl-CoA:carnitine CoA-transferase CaiB-like acyl-CoA transferase
VLETYRVLDLTNEDGLLCGQILADLGADVIQIEPPGGCTARGLGPWIEGTPGLEQSLFFAAYARNKRGLVLDLAAPSDRAHFERLVAGADFLIDSAAPGGAARSGYTHADLLSIQPGLIHVSITPFGCTGPRAAWQATDLIVNAAGGFAYLSGDAQGPPLRVGVPQAHAQAGADAAMAALVAHFERKRSGRGQHIDISQQHSTTLALMFRSLDGPIEMAPAQRIAGGLQAGGVLVPIRHATRDGWVTLGPAVLPSTGHFMKRLLEWVAEEDGCDPALLEENWGTFGLRLGAGKLPPDAYDQCKAVLDAFFATKDAETLMREAVDRRLLLAPVLGLESLVESEQLLSRAFNQTLGEGSRRGRYPGPFARFSESPIQYRCVAPDLDADGDALRREPARRPAPSGTEPEGRAPLDGVKILDLFWVIAGPTATRVLADYGADVVRVESSKQLDTLRVSPPWQYSQPSPDGAAGFQSANANKRCLCLDWTTAKGRAVLMDLVRWADVVTESFAPGVLAAHGLDWPSLRAVNPDLIMISSSIMGQTGPWRAFSGFGRLAVSFSGFQALTSLPDTPPSGPFGAYTDAIASRYNAIAILAALEHRDSTGQGQYIDLSQTEAALHFLAPAYLDWTLNGTPTRALGNQSDTASPHGIYRALGEDAWVAIAIRSDPEWRDLCELMDRADLAPRRHDHRVAEAGIEAWTLHEDAETIASRLQERGIAAYAALNTLQLARDPQLEHRDHFIEIEHAVYQSSSVESSRLSLSRSKAKRPREALMLGADSRRVLESTLGYTPDEIDALEAEGVLV